MMFVDVVRLLLTASLAAMIHTGSLEIWMIFVYALLMGATNGLFGSASNSILPRILQVRNLQKANLLSQGSAQMTGILGPVLAAVWIAFSSNQIHGIAILIALDSITFLLSVVTLGFLQAGGERAATAETINVSAVKNSTREGISYGSGHPPLCFLFLVVAGNLIGILLSSRLPVRDKKAIHILLMVIFLAFGLGLAALGWVSIAGLAAFDLLIMGLLNGYISIHLLTGVQRNTPQEFLGRVMSIVIFANVALMPFSQVLAGALLSWNVPLLFLGAAVLMIGAAIYIYMTRDKYGIDNLIQLSQ